MTATRRVIRRTFASSSTKRVSKRKPFSLVSSGKRCSEWNQWLHKSMCEDFELCEKRATVRLSLPSIESLSEGLPIASKTVKADSKQLVVADLRHSFRNANTNMRRVIDTITSTPQFKSGDIWKQPPAIGQMLQRTLGYSQVWNTVDVFELSKQKTDSGTANDWTQHNGVPTEQKWRDSISYTPLPYFVHSNGTEVLFFRDVVGDVRNSRRMHRVLKTFKPDAVYTQMESSTCDYYLEHICGNNSRVDRMRRRLSLWFDRWLWHPFASAVDGLSFYTAKYNLKGSNFVQAYKKEKFSVKLGQFLANTFWQIKAVQNSHDVAIMDKKLKHGLMDSYALKCLFFHRLIAAANDNDSSQKRLVFLDYPMPLTDRIFVVAAALDTFQFYVHSLSRASADLSRKLFPNLRTAIAHAVGGDANNDVLTGDVSKDSIKSLSWFEKRYSKRYRKYAKGKGIPTNNEQLLFLKMPYYPLLKALRRATDRIAEMRKVEGSQSAAAIMEELSPILAPHMIAAKKLHCEYIAESIDTLLHDCAENGADKRPQRVLCVLNSFEAVQIIDSIKCLNRGNAAKRESSRKKTWRIESVSPLSATVTMSKVSRSLPKDSEKSTDELKKVGRRLRKLQAAGVLTDDFISQFYSKYGFQIGHLITAD